MIKIVCTCKHLKENKDSPHGYYCWTWVECPNLGNPSFECPVIDHARNYESGKLKKTAIPLDEKEKKAKEKPKAVL